MYIIYVVPIIPRVNLSWHQASDARVEIKEVAREKRAYNCFISISNKCAESAEQFNNTCTRHKTGGIWNQELESGVG